MTSPIPLRPSPASPAVQDARARRQKFSAARESTPPPAPPIEQPYTVMEVAKLLRVSKMTVYRLTTETKTIKYIRIGKSVRITQAALREYLAAGESA